MERLRWNRGEGLDSRKLEEETDEALALPALSPASKDPDLGLEESIPGWHAGGARSEGKRRTRMETAVDRRGRETEF